MLPNAAASRMVADETIVAEKLQFRTVPGRGMSGGSRAGGASLEPEPMEPLCTERAKGMFPCAPSPTVRRRGGASSEKQRSGR